MLGLLILVMIPSESTDSLFKFYHDAENYGLFDEEHYPFTRIGVVVLHRNTRFKLMCPAANDLTNLAAKVVSPSDGNQTSISRCPCYSKQLVSYLRLLGKLTNPTLCPTKER